MIDNPQYKEKFDLVVSHSVLHIIEADTSEKFKLLKQITKPNAIIFIDALPRMTWNNLLFTVLKYLYKYKLNFVVKYLGAIVLPNRTHEYIVELTHQSYMKYFNTTNFLSLSYFDSEEFKECFELLKLNIVAQDSILSGRKARFTIRRRNNKEEERT